MGYGTHGSWVSGMRFPSRTMCAVSSAHPESRDTYQRLHVKGGSGGWPHLVPTAPPFALFSAKYAKCDQCGNPMVSPPVPAVNT